MSGRIQHDGESLGGRRLVRRNGRAELTQAAHGGFRIVGVEFQVCLHSDV
jgi:hypothetical protein